MPEFTDSKGGKWELTVNGGTVKRAAELLKIDIGDPLSGKPLLLTRFGLDIAFQVDLLYVAVKPEADRRGISDVEFAELLGPDNLHEATEAFAEAWQGFFRSLHRPEVVAAMEKQRAHLQRLWETAEGLVNSPELEEELRADLAELGSFFASSRPSRESTPGSGRSEN